MVHSRQVRCHIAAPVNEFCSNFLEKHGFSVILEAEVIAMCRDSVSISCRTAAVFSDIHSNYHAFKACYLDALEQGADCFLFLGDYISDLALPAQTMGLLYEIQTRYPTVCLRGNRERYMLDHEDRNVTYSRGSKSGSLLYTYRQLQKQDFDFFRSLPAHGLVKLNDVVLEIAHGFRNNDRCYFDQNDPAIENIFAEMSQAYLLSGHSHKQYICRRHGKTIINPGSVGIAQSGNNRAQYALLDTKDGSVQCCLRQVPYDIASVIHAQFDSGLVAYAPHWAISILYDVITGQELTLELLERVSRSAKGNESLLHDEALWRSSAVQMGMKFTKEEILAYLDATR